MFFGSAPTICAGQNGIETQHLLLGPVTPGDTVGNFHSALSNLFDRTTHFYSAQGRYWFDLQANITRQAKDQAERFHVEDVWAEIIRRLQRMPQDRSNFTRVHVSSENSGDVLDPNAAPSELLRINEEILRHLIGHTATDVRVRLEIEATRAAGFGTNTMGTISENATALGFQEASFEE